MRKQPTGRAARVTISVIDDVSLPWLKQALTDFQKRHPVEIKKIPIGKLMAKTSLSLIESIVKNRRLIWSIDGNDIEKVLRFSALWGAGCLPLAVVSSDVPERFLGSLWSPWLVKYRDEDGEATHKLSIKDALEQWFEQTSYKYLSWAYLPESEKVQILKEILNSKSLEGIRTVEVLGGQFVTGIEKSSSFDGEPVHELWLVIPTIERNTRLVNEILQNPGRFTQRLVNSVQYYLRELNCKPARTQCILVGLEATHPKDQRKSRRINEAPPGLGAFILRNWRMEKVEEFISETPYLAHWVADRQRRASLALETERDQLRIQLNTYESTVEKTHAELRYQTRLLERTERDQHWREASRIAAHKLASQLSTCEAFIKSLPGQADNRDHAMRAVERGKAILREFQSYVKATQLDKARFDLSDSLRDSLRFHHSDDFQVEVIDVWPHVFVVGDQQKLETVWTELADNAKRLCLTVAKKGALTVRPKVVSESNDKEIASRLVRVNFEDNGPGIEKDKKQDIFGPKFTGKDDEDGGLGLYFVKQIITAHGGFIREVGSPGKGANFEVLLPTENDRNIVRDRVLHLLLVDDDKDAAWQYANFLTKCFQGLLEITVVFSEIDGRARLRRQHCDAVLTDMSMDRKESGAKLCIMAKSLNPNTSTAIISGTLSRKEVEEIVRTTSRPGEKLETFCDYFLSKSERRFTEQLQEIVRTFLHTKGIIKPEDPRLGGQLA